MSSIVDDMLEIIKKGMMKMLANHIKREDDTGSVKFTHSHMRRVITLPGHTASEEGLWTCEIAGVQEKRHTLTRLHRSRRSRRTWMRKIKSRGMVVIP